MFQEAGDDLALTRVWILLWNLYQCTGKTPALRDAAEQALEHARRAGSRLDEAWSLNVLGWSLVDGPTPVPREFASATTCCTGCGAIAWARRS